MNINEVFDSLKIGNFQAALSIGWNESEKTWSKGTPLFLAEGTIREGCSISRLEDYIADYLIKELVPVVNSNPSLSRFMWHQYHLLYKCHQSEKPPARKFPMLDGILGNKAWAYNLALALAGIPAALAAHKQHGIDTQISLDTFSDIEVWCRRFREIENVTGISVNILDWLQNHLSGQLFRLGRLQFMHIRFHDRFSFFRDKKGNVLAFANGGLKLNSAGLYDGVDNIFDNNGTWETTLDIRNNVFTGHPVFPEGVVSRQKKSIILKEWNNVLSAGDGVLEVHIPAIGPMTDELCSDSYRKAVNFFTMHFPEKQFKGFTCTTWFFDPALDKLLPETSNILKFRKRYHLYPVAVEGGHKDMISRVFSIVSDSTPLCEYPRETSMQKSFIRFLEGGGFFRTGGGFSPLTVDR